MNHLSPGSISTGTLRTADLLVAMAGTLEALVRANFDNLTMAEVLDYGNVIGRAKDMATYEDSEETEDGQEMVYTLTAKLEPFAPPYCYFGTLEGDGADFGYWLDHGALEEFDGLRVSDLSEVGPQYGGEILLVNDHGNVSLYVQSRATARAKPSLRCIWSVV